MRLQILKISLNIYIYIYIICKGISLDIFLLLHANLYTIYRVYGAQKN